MKFTAKQPKLNRGFTIVGHAVPQKATLPIENYILATAEEGRVRLSARREDIGIHYWIDVESIEGEGAMLLPAHLISDFVRNVPAASVVVTSPSPAHADSCHVQCLRSSADMKNATDDPAEFPQIPSFAQGGEMLMQLDAELLKQMIAQTAFAAAEKEKSTTWSWSGGMRIEIGEGKAMFAATDSFRLAMYTLAVPDDQLRCTLLVPARTMEALAKLLPDEGTVSMLLTPDRNGALFHVETIDLSESVDLSTRLLLSQGYPNLRHAIPTEWTTRAIIQTQELASTIKLMLPYAHQNGDKIHFKLFGEQTERLSLREEPNTISLETFAEDVGKIENVVAAQVQGPDQEIYLHARYLLEVLAALDTSKIALEVTTMNRPAVIKPIGPGEYVYVMMPIQGDQTSTHQAPLSNDAEVSLTTRR